MQRLPSNILGHRSHSVIPLNVVVAHVVRRQLGEHSRIDFVYVLDSRLDQSDLDLYHTVFCARSTGTRIRHVLLGEVARVCLHCHCCEPE